MLSRSEQFSLSNCLILASLTDVKVFIMNMNSRKSVVLQSWKNKTKEQQGNHTSLNHADGLRAFSYYYITASVGE